MDFGDEGEIGDSGLILQFVMIELAVAEYFLSNTLALSFIGLICVTEEEIGILFIIEQAFDLFLKNVFCEYLVT